MGLSDMNLRHIRVIIHNDHCSMSLIDMNLSDMRPNTTLDSHHMRLA